MKNHYKSQLVVEKVISQPKQIFKFSIAKYLPFFLDYVFDFLNFEHAFLTLPKYHPCKKPTNAFLATLRI